MTIFRSFGNPVDAMQDCWPHLTPEQCLELWADYKTDLTLPRCIENSWLSFKALRKRSLALKEET